VRIAVGLPFGIEEFASQALLCQHPFDRQWVPDPPIDSLFFKLSRPVSEVIRLRTAVLESWTARASELAAAEAEFHSRMCPEIERVMSS